MHAVEGMRDADPARYAPDRVLARADVLRLTADQVAALQRLRDAQREDGLNAISAANAARDALSARQQQLIERGDDRAAPATPAPSHRHE